RAARVSSNFGLDVEDLKNPIVLDQYGRPVHLPARNHTSSNVLIDGSVATYIGYRVNRDDSLPRGFPIVVTPRPIAREATGSLRLDAVARADGDAALAKDGKVAVSNGASTLLIQPVSPGLGTRDGGSPSRTALAWLAGQVAALRSSVTPGSGSIA